MCYVRPNLVTEEISKLLKMSGCYSVRVAIECGNEPLRNKILRRNLTDEQILKSCQMLHNSGLKVGTINILGLPTETVANMKGDTGTEQGVQTGTCLCKYVYAASRR